MGRNSVDIIKTGGYKVSALEIESVLKAHPSNLECAVVGVKDELKGEVPLAFVILKADREIDEQHLQSEVVALVREEVGAIASLKRVLVVAHLPKTRSGKILRRTLRSLVEGEAVQVPSTIEDASVISELTTMLRQQAASP